MESLTAIASVAGSSLTAVSAGPQPLALQPQGSSQTAENALGSFGRLLSDGIANVDEKIATADRLVQSFALDDASVPIHQVTIALEEARLAVELTLQVRTRLVEAYRELMNTQL